MTGWWEPPRLERVGDVWTVRVDDVTTVYGKDIPDLARNYARTTGRDLVLVAICEECSHERA